MTRPNNGDASYGWRRFNIRRRLSQWSDGNGSENIISAIRGIINAGMAILERDYEAVLISEGAEARLRAALERLMGGSDTAPTVLEPLVLEADDALV